MAYDNNKSSLSDADQRLATSLGWLSIGLGLTEVLACKPLARMIGAPDNGRTHNVLRTYGMREITQGIAILSQPQSSQWIWARVAGDLLDIGSVAAAMLSEDANRTRATATLGALVGVTALDYYCADKLSQKTPAQSGPIRVTQAIIINFPAEQIYSYWRNLENLPQFMDHIESIRAIDSRRSHWKVKSIAGTTIEWDAEITADEPGKRISWRTLPGSVVEHSGSVFFERATGGRGTVVRVELEYNPPGGKITAAMAKLLGREPKQQIYDALHALKQILETGERARSEASIAAVMHPARPHEQLPEMALAR